MSSPFQEPNLPGNPVPAAPVFTTEDADQLRLLSIFYYVLGGLGFLCGCAPVFHMAFGATLAFAPQAFENHGREPDDAVLRMLGGGFLCFGCVFILLAWTLATLQIVAGRALVAQRRYTFCLVIAALICLSFPFGTALGVLTLIVLLRPGVKVRFDEADRVRFG